jgi:hypothetical protein
MNEAGAQLMYVVPFLGECMLVGAATLAAQVQGKPEYRQDGPEQPFQSDVCAFGQLWRLDLRDAARSRRRLLIDLFPAATHVDVSDADRYVAFNEERPGGRRYKPRLIVHDTHNGRWQRVAPALQGLSWSPDGSHLTGTLTPAADTFEKLVELDLTEALDTLGKPLDAP